MRTTAETVVYPVESVVVVCTCLQQWLVLVNLKGLQAEKKAGFELSPHVPQDHSVSASFLFVQYC